MLCVLNGPLSPRPPTDRAGLEGRLSLETTSRMPIPVPPFRIHRGAVSAHLCWRRSTIKPHLCKLLPPGRTDSGTRNQRRRRVRWPHSSTRSTVTNLQRAALPQQPERAIELCLKRREIGRASCRERVYFSV